jgi:hypothetical protein
MKQSLPLILVALGVALVALGLLWKTLFPPTRSWTEEKSARMGELTKEVHALLFQVEAAKQRPSMTSGRNPAEVQEEYDSKKAELAALRAEFENQRDKPQTIASVLRWTGIALVLVGGVAILTLGEA